MPQGSLHSSSQTDVQADRITDKPRGAQSGPQLLWVGSWGLSARSAAPPRSEWEVLVCRQG